MDTRRWSLSTCGQCDFVFEPPKFAQPSKDEAKTTPCVGLEKLIQEERDNHEWNVAFQKALVKRLEASERRITLDEYLGDEDDRDDRPRKRGRRGKRRREPKKKEIMIATEKPSVASEQVDAELPTAQPVFKEQECKCSKEIKKQERKRKRFVKTMEKEQARWERFNRRAQRKYEKERMKAYKKCEKSQLAIERGYHKGGKDGIRDKAEETFSVFIHMDPGECGCRGRKACREKLKRCFFKFCVWSYIFGFIIFFIVTYVLSKV